MISQTGLKAALLAFMLIGGSATALTASPATSTAQAGPAHPIRALPAALRSAVYHALAKDAGAADAINADGCASLPRQPLKACFDQSGAHFMGAGAPLALHLAAWGRVGDLERVYTAKPIITGNRVSYTHGNLSAWWRILSIGFEQGFTIAKRPAGQGKLVLALAASRSELARDSGVSVGATLVAINPARGRIAAEAAPTGGMGAKPTQAARI